jgi:hypothetical protein
LFICYGTDDEVLPLNDCGRRLVPRLKQASYPVTYVEFDGAHAACGAGGAGRYLVGGRAQPAAPIGSGIQRARIVILRISVVALELVVMVRLQGSGKSATSSGRGCPGGELQGWWWIRPMRPYTIGLRLLKSPGFAAPKSATQNHLVLPTLDEGFGRVDVVTAED